MTDGVDMSWHLLGTMCGRHESLMKYESDTHAGLMKEINTCSGERGVVYYWEDSKPIYKTVDQALEARAALAAGEKAVAKKRGRPMGRGVKVSEAAEVAGISIGYIDMMLGAGASAAKVAQILNLDVRTVRYWRQGQKAAKEGKA